MASETEATENSVTILDEEQVSPIGQTLEDVDSRLTSLPDKINLCNVVLSDLRDLRDILVKRSLQDVSLPLQK